MLIDRIDESEDHSESHHYIEHREDLTSGSLWREITKAYGRQRNDREVQGIKPAPAFQFMIDDGTDDQDDCRCHQKTPVERVLNEFDDRAKKKIAI